MDLIDGLHYVDLTANIDRWNGSMLSAYKGNLVVVSKRNSRSGALQGPAPYRQGDLHYGEQSQKPDNIVLFVQTWPDKLAKLTTSLVAQGLLNPKSELGSLSDAKALVEKQLEKTDEVIVNSKN